MMKLPKPVKIGAHTWTFKRMSKVAHDETVYEHDFGDNGACDFATRTVWLSPPVLRGQSTFLVDIILHEITHVITDLGGVKDGAEEETFVTQSAHGWTQVFADNPHLLKYISEALHPEKKSAAQSPVVSTSRTGRPVRDAGVSQGVVQHPGQSELPTRDVRGEDAAAAPEVGHVAS